MTSEAVFTVVQMLDKQLAKVELNESSRSAARHLLELRNQLMIVYKPDPTIDWTIQNKKALKVLNFFDWEMKWIK
jgi:hypothetical protein